MPLRSQHFHEKSLSNKLTKVLLIDDEADSLFPTLAQNLNPLGFEVSKESDAAKALSSIQSSTPHVILLDLHFPGDESRGDGRTTGGGLLKRIRQKFESIPVVVFTTRLDDLDLPLEALDGQPHAYFAKPDFATDNSWVERLAQAMRQAIDTARFAYAPDEADFGFFVGETKEMHEVAARIRTAAHNTLTALIHGETGSGKQLAAEAIHRLSRRTGRFEHYNCSGAHIETLDSTLFGHVRGAFSGATDTKPGLFDLADKGTLFLDEFQHIPMELQNKLITVVESSSFRPMGGNNDKKVDVRLIVATNYNLSDLVADGLLREDLAYRLGVSLIFLPPLQQRMLDLPALYKLFVAKANEATARHVLPVLRHETKNKLEEHRWPGNIRELEVTILRAVAQTKSNVLLPEDIEFLPMERSRPAAQIADVEPVTRSEQVTTSLIATLTDHLEHLEKSTRYEFLKSQGRDAQREILIEFTRRLRERFGKRVTHKTLAAELDTLGNAERDFNKIRQFLHACGVQLTRLECNQ